MTAMISDPVSRGHAKGKSPARSAGGRTSGETPRWLREAMACPGRRAGDSRAHAAPRRPGRLSDLGGGGFLLETIARGILGREDVGKAFRPGARLNCEGAWLVQVTPLA